MSATQILGGAMLTLFMFCLFFYTARGIGVGEAIRAWAFAIATTAFVVTACTLLTDK